MEFQKWLFIGLNFFLMIILLISFSTKGAHWDQVSDKSRAEENFPEVYYSVEGLIILDVLLFSLCIPIFFCFWTQKISILKYFLFPFLMILIVRFIISIVFLSGNDNYCLKEIQEYDNRTFIGNDAFYTTLKAAWGFEIFSIIAVDLIGSAIMSLCMKEIRGTNDLIRN